MACTLMTLGSDLSVGKQVALGFPFPIVVQTAWAFDEDVPVVHCSYRMLAVPGSSLGLQYVCNSRLWVLLFGLICIELSWCPSPLAYPLSGDGVPQKSPWSLAFFPVLFVSLLLMSVLCLF
ncbi:unnamed protein product [Meganyctiphanes norvegica]|uniref:Uncharacterized protein n=1 Tax=Meganyctiphanes norvegica TaxID=48144 RepID=A0AAV2S4N4_MEGNR